MSNERFFRQAFETLEENDCSFGDTINSFNKTVNKSGICPTLTTRPEGFKTAILIVEERSFLMNNEKKIEVIGNYSPSNHDASRIVSQNGIAPTVKENHGTVTATMQNLRIRKLTPKECWRLMGFDDEDFEKAEKVNSNTQLYKQAGNSIVVDVLENIFIELFKQNILSV